MPKLLMASALIFAVALPASAGELVPGVGQISHTEGYSASVCTNDPSGTLPLRSGPGQNHDEIRQIPSGKNVRVLNSRRSQDGFDWFKISYRDTRGWVRSDYVCNSRYTD
ncbi:SH3 domain-containing protein [Calothrix sp. FACHB-1219]|uniref:SH3 domain-containing protein n=1 Tax=unclassified Calothrix TaxID=2619626 RepID=UPI0016892850|nr:MULTISPECIES: SH3 domain-containing protein [unclassified Calothrix]MBD2204594.1 SH3 domain-containing protein [Calothrix sp. FACHB-168]MBD2219392.1 SH3 domain-containing protein [Calothrix sp. FACHB-1219]